MTRVVAIEEHYATAALLEATGLDLSWLPDDPHDRLLDTADGRLADMDAAGIDAGVFDRWPGLRIVLGHLGEGIPFHLQRIEDMLTPLADHLAQQVSSYFRQNFWVTTSGYFFDGPLALTRQVFGDDRVLFSVDYPYSDNKRAADWLRNLPVEQNVRDGIAHVNADRLLGLQP